MKATEVLKPGDRTDAKPRVGDNLPEIYATTAEVPPEHVKPAMRAVAAHAHDAEDARLLLDICGLLPSATPTEVTS